MDEGCIDSHGGRPEQRRVIRITDLQCCLSCTLCGGYLIDATTIIRCLHTFCRACILSHLQAHCACPLCNSILDDFEPGLHLRRDRMLQRLVYKLVPGLYSNELQRRQEFQRNLGTFGSPRVSRRRRRRNHAVKRRSRRHSAICCENDLFSVSLHYGVQGCDIKSAVRVTECRRKLSMYLRCAANVTIRVLKKLLVMKLDLGGHLEVELFERGGEWLSDDLKLLDVLYMFHSHPVGTVNLHYVIVSTVPLTSITRGQSCGQFETSSSLDHSASNAIVQPHCKLTGGPVHCGYPDNGQLCDPVNGQGHDLGGKHCCDRVAGQFHNPVIRQRDAGEPWPSGNAISQYCDGDVSDLGSGLSLCSSAVHSVMTAVPSDTVPFKQLNCVASTAPGLQRHCAANDRDLAKQHCAIIGESEQQHCATPARRGVAAASTSSRESLTAGKPTAVESGPNASGSLVYPSDCAVPMVWMNGDGIDEAGKLMMMPMFHLIPAQLPYPGIEPVILDASDGLLCPTDSVEHFPMEDDAELASRQVWGPAGVLWQPATHCCIPAFDPHPQLPIGSYTVPSAGNSKPPITQLNSNTALTDGKKSQSELVRNCTVTPSGAGSLAVGSDHLQTCSFIPTSGTISPPSTPGDHDGTTSSGDGSVSYSWCSFTQTLAAASCRGPALCDGDAGRTDQAIGDEDAVAMTTVAEVDGTSGECRPDVVSSNIPRCPLTDATVPTHDASNDDHDGGDKDCDEVEGHEKENDDDTEET